MPGDPASLDNLRDIVVPPGPRSMYPLMTSSRAGSIVTQYNRARPHAAIIA